MTLKEFVELLSNHFSIYNSKQILNKNVVTDFSSIDLDKIYFGFKNMVQYIFDQNLSQPTWFALPIEKNTVLPFQKLTLIQKTLTKIDIKNISLKEFFQLKDIVKYNEFILKKDECSAPYDVLYGNYYCNIKDIYEALIKLNKI